MPQITLKPVTIVLPADTIYASPNGVATASGTQSSPTTLLGAISKARATGSTIALLGQLESPYRLGTILLNKSIKFVQAPGAKPVLSGAKLVSADDWVTEASLFYINHDVVFDGTSDLEPARDKPYAKNLQQLFVNNERYQQVGSKSELVAKTFYVQLATSTSPGRIYVKDNLKTSGLKVEVSVTDFTFTFRSGSGGCKFIGIGIEKYAEHVGFFDNHHNITFDGCTIHYNGRYGLGVRGCNNFTVRDCDISYSGLCGIGMGIVTYDLLIERNRIYGSNSQGNFALTWASAGIKLITGAVHGDNNTNIIRYNEVYDNNSHGIWLDYLCRGYEIHDNLCYRNLTGIFVEASGKIGQPNLVVNNLVHSNKVGLYVSHARSTYFYNNTAVNNNISFKVHYNGRKNPNAAEVAKGYDFVTEDVKFVNNLCDSGQVGGSTFIESASNLRDTDQMVSEMHHNAYYRRVAARPETIYKWRDNGVNESYNTLGDFKAAFPNYEVSSIIRSPIDAHPYFVSNNKYEVKPSSPTKSAGAPVPAAVSRILGLAADSTVDIGQMPKEDALTTDPNTDTTPIVVDACQQRIDDALFDILAEIALANDTIFGLEAEIERLNRITTTTTAEATIRELRASIATLTSANAALATDKAALTTDKAALTANKMSLEASIAALTSTKSTLETENANLRQQLNTMTLKGQVAVDMGDIQALVNQKLLKYQ